MHVLPDLAKGFVDVTDMKTLRQIILAVKMYSGQSQRYLEYESRKVRRLERRDYSWVRWCMPIILELDSLRQEDYREFKANLCYITGLKPQYETLSHKAETTTKPVVREAERCSQKEGWGNKRGRLSETEGRRDRERNQKWFLEVVNSKFFKGLQLDCPV